ncbi:hypothetical protein HAX54_004979, partial [Datura stramonium]|nr:hypothetical protein [Datura stramonium]
MQTQQVKENRGSNSKLPMKEGMDADNHIQQGIPNNTTSSSIIIDLSIKSGKKQPKIDDRKGNLETDDDGERPNLLIHRSSQTTPVAAQKGERTANGSPMVSKGIGLEKIGKPHEEIDSIQEGQSHQKDGVNVWIGLFDKNKMAAKNPLGREKALFVQDESKKEDKPIEQAMELDNDWKMVNSRSATRNTVATEQRLDIENVFRALSMFAQNILTEEKEAGSRKISDGGS